jgi:hypothetical protein
MVRAEQGLGVSLAMPRLTFPIDPDGLILRAMLGPEQKIVQSLQAQGQPLPPWLHARALLDTGTTITAVAPRLLTALGVARGPTVSTQTAAGSATVSLYAISFSIYDPAAPAGTNLTRDTWEVTDMPQNLPDIDVLFGMDLVREIILTADGPAQTFTLDF